ALERLGLLLASPISFLKAGILDDEYNHILSFRRQTYVLTISDDFELETSIVIPFNDNNHRIFLSTEKMECFLCKHTWHIASNCPNPPSTLGTHQSQRSGSNSSIKEIVKSNTTKTDNILSQPPSIEQPGQKRGHSDVASTGESSNSPEVISQIVEMPPPSKYSTTPNNTK
ncbi:hypothetical protein HHI36_013004, partial [Cryptolaemus montrouzieri]